MDVDRKIAVRGWNANGAKRGRTATSRRSRRANKRGARTKALRIVLRPLVTRPEA